MQDFAFDLEKQLQLSFADVSKSIRQESRSVRNRILSIAHDSRFAQAVSAGYSLPLVANERCGRWYIPSDRIAESVYFKSTDGHTGQWDFSTRRLNLHILDLVKEHGGAVIVDSTRRGKRMPDAMSKTIPIWCAVLNNLVFNEPQVYTPRDVVSRSEHDQIEQRINKWTESARTSGLDLSLLRQKMSKPLRPLWITPGDYLPEEPLSFDSFTPLVLCTASRMVQDGADFREGYTYVQGAADDHEMWAGGLTPDILWGNSKIFLNPALSDSELYTIIDRSVEAEKGVNKRGDLLQIKPTSIFFGFGDVQGLRESDTVIDVREKQADLKFSAYKWYPLPEGKKGAKQLRSALPLIMDWLEGPVKESDASVLRLNHRISVISDSGTDFAPCIALAILCIFFSKESLLLSKRTSAFLDKTEIRNRLVTIITQHKINPSRASLNSVNSFLMG